MDHYLYYPEITVVTEAGVAVVVVSSSLAKADLNVAPSSWRFHFPFTHTETLYCLSIATIISPQASWIDVPRIPWSSISGTGMQSAFSTESMKDSHSRHLPVCQKFSISFVKAIKFRDHCTRKWLSLLWTLWLDNVRMKSFMTNWDRYRPIRQARFCRTCRSLAKTAQSCCNHAYKCRNRNNCIRIYPLKFTPSK